ncbi:unnamed protein product [Rangifer tarandus platyrhynchus]|uniref:Uncharacterized protein n=1 Tax=Rangifer tarandus platyrhynchus TaxID=3082113 RepID=A0AC59ZFY1_RANTA
MGQAPPLRKGRGFACGLRRPRGRPVGRRACLNGTDEDQDGSGDAGRSGHEPGSGGPAVLRWKEATSPRSALARGVGSSPLRPWYSHRGPISSASAQVSSRRVLTVAFTQRCSRALQTTGGLRSTEPLAAHFSDPLRNFQKY